MICNMKKDIHPTNYRPVIFQDINSGFKVLTYSTINLGNNPKTIKWEDGKQYEVAELHISSRSHSFYTLSKNTLGQSNIIDKFNKKYSKKK